MNGYMFVGLGLGTITLIPDIRWWSWYDDTKLLETHKDNILLMHSFSINNHGSDPMH